jgi:hypothetical protein
VAVERSEFKSAQVLRMGKMLLPFSGIRKRFSGEHFIAPRNRFVATMFKAA